MRRLPVAALLLLAVACSPGSDEIAHDYRIHTMGTVVSLTLYHARTDEANRIAADMEEELHAFAHRWWSWGEGEMGQLNSGLGRGESTPVPGELQPELGRALKLAQQSGSRFHPGVGQLVRLWGLHRSEIEPRMPESDQIAALLPLPALSHLQPQDGQITPPRPLVLDTGGFAKGLAVDQVATSLRAQGVERAIISAGGDVRTIGRRADRPWRIAVRAPRGQGVIGWIEVEDNSAVFSSGDYERGFEHDGQRYHHIIDPRTGYPAIGSRAVTVLHEDALVADIASTALFVAGPHEWRETAAALGVTTALLIDTDGRVHLTPAMAERIHFTEPAPPLQTVPDVVPARTVSIIMATIADRARWPGGS